jgi:hypothetical protein
LSPGRGLGIFFFATASRPALGSVQPPNKWYQGLFSLGVIWPGREADNSLPSSAESHECVEVYLHSPNTLSRRGAQLKHRDNFTFFLPLPSSQVLHDKLTVVQPAKKFTPFMESKVHCHVRNRPTLQPVLSQLNPFHHITSYFYEMHFNIILSSTSRSSNWFLLFRFSDQKFFFLNFPFSHASYMPHQSYPLPRDHHNNIF